MHLDLIHSGHGTSMLFQCFQMLNPEIGHSDGADLALLLHVDQGIPGFHQFSWSKAVPKFKTSDSDGRVPKHDLKCSMKEYWNHFRFCSLLPVFGEWMRYKSKYSTFAVAQRA